MMKRMLVLLLWLMMVLPISYAQEIGAWSVWCMGEKPTFAGCGVQTAGDILLSATCALPEGRENAAYLALREDGEVVQLTLQEKGELVTYWTMAGQNENVKNLAPLQEGRAVLGWYDGFETAMKECVLSYPVEIMGVPCLRMMAGGDVPYGTGVYTQDRTLCGLVVAKWDSGEFNLVVAPVTQRLSSVEKNIETVPVDFTLQAANGRKTIQWDAEKTPVVSMFVQDVENTIYQGVAGLKSGTILLSGAPGHEYMVWLFEGEVSRLPQVKAQRFVTMPEGEKYTDYNLVMAESYIGLMPQSEGEGTTTRARRIETITPESFKTPGFRAVWQVVNTYSVQQSHSMMLTAAMTLPTGETIMLTTADSLFTLMPEIADGDVWSLSLQALVTVCESVYGSIPAGEYTIDCYFDDRHAMEYQFTVED